MALNEQQNSSLLAFTSIMFGFAPDAESYARFDAILSANPSFNSLANNLAATEAFTGQFEGEPTANDLMSLLAGRLNIATDSDLFTSGVNFITARLDSGSSVGEIFIEIGELLLSDTVPELLQDAAAVMQNTIAVSQAYLDSGLVGYSNDVMPTLFDNITSDAQSVTDAQAAIDDAVDAAAPFTLTKGLEDLAAANTALADFIEGIDLNEDGEADYADAEGLEAGAEAATGAVDDLIAAEGAYEEGSDAVKTQLLNNAITALENDIALEEIQLAEAQAAVDAVAGLTAAVTAAEAAAQAAEDAAEAQTAAENTADIESATTLATLNADADLDTAEDTAGVITVDVDAAEGAAGFANDATLTLTAIDADTGLVELADADAEWTEEQVEFFEEAQALVADYITAFNAAVDAADATEAAEAASAEADAVVSHLDINAEDEAVVDAIEALGAGFTLNTPANEDLPTYAEVQKEIGDLITAAAQAFTVVEDEVADFAGEDGAVATAEAAAEATVDFSVDADAENTVADGSIDFIWYESGANAGYQADEDTLIASVNAETGKLVLADAEASAIEADLVTQGNQYNAALAAAVETLDAAQAFAFAATDAAGAEDGDDLFAAYAEGNLVDGEGSLTDLLAEASAETGLYDVFLAADGEDALTDALTAASEALEAETAEGEYAETNAGALAQLNDAVADEAELADLAAQAADLQAAIDAATDAFAENGFGEPVTLATETTYYAGSEDDLFVADTEVSATVRYLGDAGDDVLYIGTAHTVNMAELAAETDAEEGVQSLADAGDQSVLEVFMTETGGNTTLWFEQETFSSEVADFADPTAEGDFTSITLTGVSIADITIVDGVLTVA